VTTKMLGNTGEKVSQFCLGCMYFGSRIDEPQSYKLLDQYIDAGGSFLDTANNYAFWVDGFQGGESEQVLGRWMHERGNRNKLFLSTKVGFNMPPRVPISLSRKTIIEFCEKSLKQLQTDHIDLYYAHWDHRETPLEETLAAFDQLVQQGKIRYIGCSNMLTWRIEKARILSRQNNWPEFCCTQLRHSYLRPKTGLQAFLNGHVPVNTDTLDYAKTNADNFTLVAYSALLGGVYTDPDHQIPDFNQPESYDVLDKQARLKVLAEIAKESGATANQVVLAWITQSDPGMISLISSSSTERLQENIDADQVVLSEEQLKRLNEASA
jgi:aryl-alcohol dehydrogenase-like predicted oxidoreductase